MSIIKQDLISSSKYSLKCPYEMKPIGIAIHNTYNDAPAKNEIAYMKKNESSTGYHIAVDDKEAIQVIPFNRNAFANGDGKNGEGNRKYISIEICYSKSGGTRFANAEKLASKVVAELLKKYGWGIDRVKAHRDFAKKDCPHRTNMTEFKKLVEKELGNSNTISETSVNQEGVVSATSLNVRKGASTSHASLGTISKDTKVSIVAKCSNGWLKIKYNNGYGYVSGDYITNIKDILTSYVVRVICDELNIREGAGTSHKVVGVLKRGDAYTVVEEKDGWGLLKSYQSKRNGWISLNSKYVQKV